MEVDIKTLVDYNISPNQFLLAYSIHKNDKDFHNLKDIIGEKETENELKKLEDKGFIKIKDEKNILNFTSIDIRNKFLFIIEEGDYFDELVERYPIKVFRPDGTKDYLRSDLSRCRRNYKKIAPSRKKHKRILDSLEFEKKVREKEDSWKYMKKLPKWLSSEEYKVFEERMKDEEKLDEDLGYGQTLS